MRIGKQCHEAKYIANYHFHEEKDWRIEWMCKGLGISRAAYYKWLLREIPEQELENLKLAELIKEYYERFGHT